MSKNIYQKLTTNGKPIVDNNRLPVFTRNVDTRIRTAKEILTIGMNSNDARWYNVQNECKLKIF